jgi:acyl-CoA hydrolase
VDTLEPGAGVVTSRADVHYVVTEHGIARLHGRSLRERAQELIAVAHPDFRAELREAARRRRLL